MTLGELKDFFESLPEHTEFYFDIPDFFSWRGSYDECAFDIKPGQSSREKILERIEQAFENTHYGWKGGEFYFDEDTSIHLEEHYGIYSDTEYLKAQCRTFDVQGDFTMQNLIETVFKPIDSSVYRITNPNQQFVWMVAKGLIPLLHTEDQCYASMLKKTLKTWFSYSYGHEVFDYVIYKHVFATYISYYEHLASENGHDLHTAFKVLQSGLLDIKRDVIEYEKDEISLMLSRIGSSDVIVMGEQKIFYKNENLIEEFKKLI